MFRKLTLALLAAALVSCMPPAPTQSPRDQAITAWRTAIQCVRDHGFTVPDPSFDDRGNASFPPDFGKPPADVMAACKQQIDALPNQTGNAERPSAEDLRLGRQFAACMRQNGLPEWPDPNADGTFPSVPSIEAQGKSPTFIAAFDSCARFHPSGRIFISAGNGG
jgi:hypothetical protein